MNANTLPLIQEFLCQGRTLLLLHPTLENRGRLFLLTSQQQVKNATEGIMDADLS